MDENTEERLHEYIYNNDNIYNLEMFRNLKNSRHGHNVCRPQTLSVFVCLQSKCKSWWRCPTQGFVCFYIRTPRGGDGEMKIEV